MLLSRSWMLIWNPTKFDWEAKGFWSEYKTVNSKGYLDGRWSCGWKHSRGPTGPRVGGRFFMLRVGDDRPGLVASGRFLSRPSARNTWKDAPLARIRFEYLADFTSRTEFLCRESLVLLTGDHLHYAASGMPIRPDVAARFELLLGLIFASRASRDSSR